MEHHHISAEHLSLPASVKSSNGTFPGTERRCPDSHRPLPRIPRPQDGKPRAAGLRHHHRIRFAVRHFGGLRRAGAVAEEPRDVACLRYRRAGAFRGHVKLILLLKIQSLSHGPFGRAACDRGAADRLFSTTTSCLWSTSRGSLETSTGRLAAGAHEPCRLLGLGEVEYKGWPGCRRAGGAGVAADRSSSPRRGWRSSTVRSS